MAEPADKKSACRKIDGIDLNKHFCMKYSRVVGNDNTVSFMNRKIRIPNSETRYGFAKAKADAHHLIDGRIRIFYKETLITEIKSLDEMRQIKSKRIRERISVDNKSYERISLQL